MIAHIDGESYVFRGDEIETIMEIGKYADSPAEAWEMLKDHAYSN